MNTKHQFKSKLTWPKCARCMKLKQKWNRSNTIPLKMLFLLAYNLFSGWKDWVLVGGIKIWWEKWANLSSLCTCIPHILPVPLLLKFSHPLPFCLYPHWIFCFLASLAEWVIMHLVKCLTKFHSIPSYKIPFYYIPFHQTHNGMPHFIA